MMPVQHQNSMRGLLSITIPYVPKQCFKTHLKFDLATLFAWILVGIVLLRYVVLPFLHLLIFLVTNVPL